MTAAALLPLRIGYGEDAHRLEVGRPLILAATEIEDAPRGSVAHSDGDAVLHAVSDALLSGLALGDIGQYFPDTDPQWAGLASGHILQRCLELVAEQGYRPLNVAVVVTLDQPKLGVRRGQIAQALASLLGLASSEVGVSFKTSEGLAPDHVQVRCTVLLGHQSGQ
ncbi:2-C-methyl-D-erythritol 2,4-cyclodiphosphate synthase [Deinococcus sonorensis]|uniref:2-C-methyl-D-erythritol 2,4-cyclodiphosphate synthase n=2 Tax=Deinococcus sonorensis TaxID=309891 RepID=A0AAU7U7E8_9DEIO